MLVTFCNKVRGRLFKGGVVFKLRQETLMHRSKLIFSILGLSIFVLASSLPIRAQGDPRPVEPSYDAVLQIVIGGDDKANMPLPQNLAAVAKQLKANYPYPEYKLANTYVGRIAVNGNLENKSISNVFGQTQQGDTPSFWEWGLGGLRASPTAGGRNDLAFNMFRFGARIPVRTGNVKDASGNTQSIFNYENIGLNTGRLTVTENTPTLIGSLALPNTAGTAFLVLTLRPA